MLMCLAMLNLNCCCLQLVFGAHPHFSVLFGIKDVGAKEVE